MINHKGDDNRSMTTQLSMPIEANHNEISYDSLPESTIDPLQLQEQQERLNLFNIRKLARSIPLPTTDAEIMLKLREINEPIILFGEKPYERSDRLRQSIEALIIKHKGIPDFLLKTIKQINTASDKEFYTEGSKSLLEARKKILKYSLPRNQYRIVRAKRRFLAYDKEQEEEENEKLFASVKNYEFTQSQIGDNKGCSRGMMSADGTVYGVAGWSGVCNVFSIDNLKLVLKLIGHCDKVNSITFHPGYGTSIDSKGPCALTASDDCTIRLWSMDLTLQSQKSIEFKGHEHKVRYADYHPMGTLIGSCSDDKTIRLWDIISKKELLIQEGHGSSVKCLSFQSDGALLASADQGGIGLVWDLRSGKVIASLTGHAKEITALKFSPNCYHIATGSDDNSLKLWDLRRNSCLQTIPAHTDLITDISFEPEDAKYIITTSFDSKIKIWNSQNWCLIKSYESIEDKLLSLSINSAKRKMITCAFGKTIKLWDAADNMQID